MFFSGSGFSVQQFEGYEAGNLTIKRNGGEKKGRKNQ